MFAPTSAMGEIRGKICLSVLFVGFTVIIQLKSCGAAVEGRDALTLNTSISASRTIISKNGTFELGFFNPNGTSNWYIGIWYANVTERTYVWVANRENPAKNKTGVFKFSEGGDLGLFDATGASLWSVSVTKKPSLAVILDSGNFVMFRNADQSEIVWQSFDNPTDTWLPGMRFGGHQKLVSWKNSFDPAPGLFSYHADSRQFVLTWNNSKQYWSSGTWDGKVFSQVPEMSSKVGFFNISVEDNNSSLYATYAFATIIGLSRIVLVKSGEFQQFSLLADGIAWNTYWSQPRDQCTVYGLCGAYGSCNSNNLQFCSCVDGFTPKDSRSWESRESWADGCVRQNSLNCNPQNGSTDRFMEPSVTLPDVDSASSYPGATTKKDCEQACLLNCSCTAFTFNPASGVCQIWSGDLLNMHKSEPKSNSSVFIRVSASALPGTGKSSSSKNHTAAIVGGVVGGVVALAIAVGLFTFLVRRRKRIVEPQRWAESSNPLLRTFTYRELKSATKNFTQKLGGSSESAAVFKGTLRDSTQVAVKRIGNSRNGEKEFHKELSTVGRLKHQNLIELRGFCSEQSQNLLVYEYMSNGFLDTFLFDNSKAQCKVLDWNTRFQIALGTAKGIAYLHDKEIVHCNIKPENILLDSKFIPKVGGLGLAKIEGIDFSHEETFIRGTRGYLAPEWMSGLPITAKADVYSFGMTLLEIIAGRRNSNLIVESSSMFFQVWAAEQMKRDNPLLSEDGDGNGEFVGGNSEGEEIRRATMVGGWCVQEREEARPHMWQVLKFLQNPLDLQTSQALQLLLHGKGHCILPPSS